MDLIIIESTNNSNLQSLSTDNFVVSVLKRSHQLKKIKSSVICFFILVTFQISAGAQSEAFYHELPFQFNDSVSMIFQQNSYQISDSTYLSIGNYGHWSQAGFVISNSSGEVLEAKYLQIGNSIHPDGIARLDTNKFVLYGDFDLYHNTTGGFIDRAAAMVCINKAGDVLWEKAYGGYSPGYPDITEPTYKYSDAFTHAEPDNSSQRIYSVGYSASYNEAHKPMPYIVCTDYTGDTIWTWTMSVPEYKEGVLNSTIVTTNGDIIAVGYVILKNEKRANNLRGLIIKISPSGEMAWHRTWGTNNAVSWEIIELSENIYIVGGTQIPEESVAGHQVGNILKFDDNGNLIQSRSIVSGYGNAIAKINKLICLDSGFAAVSTLNIKDEIGYTIGGNLNVTKYTGTLNMIEEKNYGNDGDLFALCGISEAFNGSLLFTGFTGLESEIKNILMKSNGDLELPMSGGWNSIETLQTENTINYYPNPANEILHVSSADNTPIGEIAIIDMFGKVCYKAFTGEPSVEIKLNHMKSGIYLLKCNNEISGKLIISH